ncbi:ABC transporter ATP-binding protein [Thermocrinis minervae]|uniref:Lipoprotein-releasing system ATP-binding protein n=1 Tax=Thermocrinis minervae TaxID=381751 RepID=A0A1M6RMG3_9AQUI|nr:ABC transporter ATP-binding protein [Thermocrinis minervae]SHK33663.1 lipoprotein-releasing system ATP-binding protein [Thermocrinis minervae]
MKAITLRDVSKEYGNVKALKSINLEIMSGEFVGIMGPSGSGKSTLLYLIAGLEKPTSGSIEVLGTDVTSMKEDQLSEFRKNNMAFVFQFYYLLEDFNVLENLTIVGELARVKEPKKKALELLDYLRLSHRKNHKPNQLSGGEQQRVAIGRALMLEPKIILADEPTGNLDMEDSLRIFNLFKSLNEEKGITFLIATHNVELTSYFGRIVRLRDGMLV